MNLGAHRNLFGLADPVGVPIAQVCACSQNWQTLSNQTGR